MEEIKKEIKVDNVPASPTIGEPRKSKASVAVWIIPVVLVVLIIAPGFFAWQLLKKNNELNSSKAALEQEKSTLQQDISELQQQTEMLKNEKIEIEKLACKGAWKDGACVKNTCIDSDVNEKPNDIYIKGSVTTTDQNGVATTVADECTGTEEQVNEMWCYESPAGSGNFVGGREIFNCPKRCFDGACIK